MSIARRVRSPPLWCRDDPEQEDVADRVGEVTATASEVLEQVLEPWNAAPAQSAASRPPRWLRRASCGSGASEAVRGEEGDGDEREREEREVERIAADGDGGVCAAKLLERRHEVAERPREAGRAITAACSGTRD